MTVKKLQSGLALHSLMLMVRLGWLEAERQQAQSINLDLRLNFKTPPHACESDNLKDTACYATLAEAIRTRCADGEFKLLEHLAAELYETIRPLTPAHADVMLKVTKLNPPIKDLAGGASFYYGDGDTLQW